MTRAIEAVALKFAKTHHSELYDLLLQLKRNRPTQYQPAILELYGTSERLDRLKDNKSDRYEHSLQLWKFDSRIRLLAARMTMSSDPMLEAEIKSLLLERLELRLQQLTTERDQLQSRVEKLNENIDAIANDRDSAALKELERLKKSLARYTLKADSRTKRTRANSRTKQTPQKRPSKRSKPTGNSRPPKTQRPSTDTPVKSKTSNKPQTESNSKNRSRAAPGKNRPLRSKKGV